MSGLPPVFFPLPTLPEAVLQEIMIVPQRSIGGIVATVTVREDHNDQMIITQHPVEQGASISDHAFKQPAEVLLEVGWSLSDGVTTDITATLPGVYAQLLNLQAQRNPFTLFTGKRMYTNMLIASLRTYTDQERETSFVAQVLCREVILVSTQAVSNVPASTTVQQVPQSTTNVIPQGTQQAQPTGSFNASVVPTPPVGFSVIP
jgi:hypothetical protein